MSFVEPNAAVGKPGFSDFYIAALAACFLVYFVLFTGGVVASIITGSAPDVAEIFAFLIVGLFFGSMITAFFGAVFIAPIAALISFTLSRFAPSGYWQGVVTGAICGPLVGYLFDGFGNSKDTGGGMLLPITLGLVGTVAGYVVQKWIIAWPKSRVTD